jgi:hypothetical protein
VSGTHLGPATSFSPFLKILFRQLRGLLMWSALSDERSGSVVFSCFCASPAQFFIGSESRGTHDHILFSQFLRLPKPGGPGSCVHSLRNRVDQLYPRHWGYNCCLIVSCSADFSETSVYIRTTGLYVIEDSNIKKDNRRTFWSFQSKYNIYLFPSNIYRRKLYLNPRT